MRWFACKRCALKKIKHEWKWWWGSSRNIQFFRILLYPFHCMTIQAVVAHGNMAQLSNNWTEPQMLRVQFQWIALLKTNQDPVSISFIKFLGMVKIFNSRQSSTEQHATQSNQNIAQSVPPDVKLDVKRSILKTSLAQRQSTGLITPVSADQNPQEVFSYSPAL